MPSAVYDGACQDPPTVQTLRYGPHRQHVMDLGLPEDGNPTRPYPVAFVLHGGFWRARYKRVLMEDLCADLVVRGWAAVNVEYRRVGRLTGGGGGVPQTLDDVAAALDHLASVAAPLDLDRVVSVGHSAGGHLALWAAAGGRDRDRARVRCAGAVGQAALSDLERAAELGLGAGIVRRFCGGGPESVPDQYRRASPAARLPLGVPQLLVHGERDDIVPASLSKGYAMAARAGGDDVALVLRPDDGHFEHLDPASGAWEAVTGWLTRFER
ncbi:MAG: alpha/beta hydrolase [Actinomycetota bacterium]|nr:alpha/beta hydrolase [Actinomycetota bacterium]